MVEKIDHSKYHWKEQGKKVIEHKRDYSERRDKNGLTWEDRQRIEDIKEMVNNKHDEFDLLEGI